MVQMRKNYLKRNISVFYVAEKFVFLNSMLKIIKFNSAQTTGHCGTIDIWHHHIAFVSSENFHMGT